LLVGAGVQIPFEKVTAQAGDGLAQDNRREDIRRQSKGASLESMYISEITAVNRSGLVGKV
jgi:hypothetical protein